MSYPAEAVELGYRNHVEDIRSFLDSRHADHYTVFNLSQRNYRGAKFSNRVRRLISMYRVQALRKLLCSDLTKRGDVKVSVELYKQRLSNGAL